MAMQPPAKRLFAGSIPAWCSNVVSPVRTLDSLKQEEARLRKLHTQYAAAGDWLKAQTVREKLVRVLNQMKAMQENKLTTTARKHIAPKNFALPGRRYPIEDPAHARNALARVSQHGSPEEKAKVRAKVHRKYPGIGESAKAIVNALIEGEMVGGPHRKIPVKIRRPDGSVIDAEFSGYYDNREFGLGAHPSIGYPSEGGMTHGILRKGDELQTEVPDPDAWKAEQEEAERARQASTPAKAAFWPTM